MLIPFDKHEPFKLTSEFLAPYRRRPVPWGFGTLSWVTYKRTYSRDREEWWQTCQRVIEGMCNVQKIHCRENKRIWNPQQARYHAQNAYDRMWQFKWTPPGRGLWIMGTEFMYDRGGAALNNCGFVSTRDIAQDYAAPFLWMLKMSMLGVGVGFDTRGVGRAAILPPTLDAEPCVIPDNREGWTAALARLLNAYTGQGTLPQAWDFSQIRPRGTPLKSFGGTASGPEPLRIMLAALQELYNSYAGRQVDARLLVDTMNLIGRCVVAGGIRRSAQIALGQPDDQQFLTLKDDRQKLDQYRWVSNNSVFAEPGMDYAQTLRHTLKNGEPGFLWLRNAQAYGRRKDPENWRDADALGSNPCVEQTLGDRELCCLVETFPARHRNLQDYLESLKYAYMYAKTVTLLPTNDDGTNRIMRRNRRIGCSMTGIVQAIDKFGDKPFFNWCDQAYAYVQQLDHAYAAWLGIPRSIKTTSVKPSGSVSLLAGATPGVHWEYAPFYIRRIRVAARHPIIAPCQNAEYQVEPDHYAPDTMVVSFPVQVHNLHRRKKDVSVREKIELAVRMQQVWSDNQVSCTVEFDPDREAADIPGLLAEYDTRLKAIVFLPRHSHGYTQPPYEEISADKYQEMTVKLRPIHAEIEHEHELESRFCEGPTCELT